jgi:hypothetical protein
VDASSEAIVIQFVPNPPIDPMKVITMIQSKQPPDTVGRSPLVREGGPNGRSRKRLASPVTCRDRSSRCRDRTSCGSS